MELIEASAAASADGDHVLALEKAKEAGKKERSLHKFRAAHKLLEQANVDLMYCVCFNLAQAYAACDLAKEATDTYMLLVKNNTYPTAGRLRVNVGNVHFARGDYAEAVKQYRMALDQVTGTNSHLRLRIQRNIAAAFIKQGQFTEAITVLEAIMGALPDFQSAFNLLVCHAMRGDEEEMKSVFTKLIRIPRPGAGASGEGEDAHEETKFGEDEDDMAESTGPSRANDALAEEVRTRQRTVEEYILTGARLIAPQIYPGNPERGYDWVIERLRMDYPVLASEVQIIRAVSYMQSRSFERAIDELKAFEKRDTILKAKAATNLSFLYFLESDLAQATKYANLAVKHDRYNARALVNLGNCLVESGEPDRAKELFLEAIGVEADCVEAIYNLGLVNKQLGYVQEAAQAFEKLHTIIPRTPEVLWHLATAYETLGATDAALKYYNLLSTAVPSDASVLSRLGAVYAKDEDDTQAFHFYSESYRVLPTDLDVVSWLGIWFVKSELYEKAIEFFERAAEIQPKEVKWQLMVASCYRRMAAYSAATELYERIHARFPENIECLSYLVALCRDLDKPYDEYEAKLVRLERAQALQDSMVPTSAVTPGGMGHGGMYDDDGEEGEQSGYGMGGGSSAYGGGAAASPAGRRGASPTGPDRYSAPHVASVAGGPGADGKVDDDQFSDADLDDLLTE